MTVIVSFKPHENLVMIMVIVNVTNEKFENASLSRYVGYIHNRGFH